MPETGLRLLFECRKGASKKTPPTLVNDNDDVVFQRWPLSQNGAWVQMFCLFKMKQNRGFFSLILQPETFFFRRIAILNTVIYMSYERYMYTFFLKI